MKTMRYLVVLVLMLCISGHAFAQSADLSTQEDYRYAIVSTSDEGALSPLRKEPREYADIKYSYYSGTLAKVLNEDENGWCEVSIAGIRGYMLTEDLEFGDYNELATELPIMQINNKTDTGWLNLRTGPSLESPIIRAYYNTDRVHVMGVSAEWYHVIGYGTRTGFMNPAFLKYTGDSSEYSIGEDLLQQKPVGGK